MIIKNAELVSSSPMIAITLLFDVISQIAESRSLWSALRLETRAAQVQSLFLSVGSTLSAFDLAVALEIYTACGAEMIALHDAPETCAIQAMESLTQALAMAIRTLPHKSTADFTKSMANLGKQYEVPLISTCVAGAVARATSNENVRQAIYSVLQDIAELISFGIPKDAASALELWLARGSQSFFGKGRVLAPGGGEAAVVACLRFR